MKSPRMQAMVFVALAACTSGSGGPATGTGGRPPSASGGAVAASTGGSVATGGRGTGGAAPIGSGGASAPIDAGETADASPPDQAGSSPIDSAADDGIPTPDGTVSIADASAPEVSPVDTGALPAGWWDPAWTKRSKITIADVQLQEEQTDFQVPIRLEAASFDYAAVRTGGQDIRLVDDAGKLLNHQIDTWDPVGGSLLWVRLPKLTVAPTVVWLYYGNAAAAATPDADSKAVWPAPYAGVWHLSGDTKDSTPHAFDGMTTVGGSYVAAKQGRGFKLSGAARDHIDLKNNIKLVANAAGCTFSAWINPTNIENSVNGVVIMTLGKWFSDNHNSYVDFNVNADGQMISHVDPGNSTTAGGYTRVNSDSGIVKANEWQWVTYVIDLAGSQERFYKNGALASTKSATFLARSFIDMVSSRTVIGTEEDNIDHWYTGIMDELRLETGMRTAGWIAAQYRAMTVPGFVKVEADR